MAVMAVLTHLAVIGPLWPVIGQLLDNFMAVIDPLWPVIGPLLARYGPMLQRFWHCSGTVMALVLALFWHWFWY